MARQHGYEYIWIDTCCIDKSSSAELSEAINSMFKWYETSGLCLVFLADFTESSGLDPDSLSKSRWFTRGWTLQELLAPPEVKFYDFNWTFVGDRSIRSILSDFSIGTRMNWDSDRRTTREEDTSYSLLGIFDVNMPLMYGEGGSKAFRRLRNEIIRTSTNDQSIVGWGAEADQNRHSSVLAHHPMHSG
ncbi:hypothetical protein QBC46DRAFT_420065 [Diplogelasinospora grovesii]|uniref:Heterokaryon incompatibility domain-containing protein n=1 Tax=Diplogelasinospora grovesii TaxID=303347 RepID=A0AAN6NG93_9PEZI|nr:hypothetical protein QBC46DRAFT_420065 [Diplogelasinospora grovesii]